MERNDPDKRAWAFARYVLKLSDEEFDSLSTEQFAYLSDQVIEDWERQDFRMAQLCALMYNLNRSSGAKALKPSDFTPDYRKKHPVQRSEEQLFEQIKAIHFALTKELIT